jgi:polyribonucleotide nucleotidyltransferase
VKIAAFGAFVSLLPGKDGLLHISEVRKLAGGKRVENVEDVLGVGQKVLVEITKIDDRGKLSLAPVTEDAGLSEAADADSRVAASVGPEGPAEG